MIEKLEPNDWQDHITLGLKFREKYGLDNRWKRWREMYTGDYGGGLVPVNMLFSNGKIMVPKCYFRNPRVKVIPKKPTAWYSARVVEAVDNHLIREMGFKYQIKAMIEDVYTAGTSFGKIGYDSQYGYFPNSDELGVEESTQETIKGSGDKANIEKTEYNVNVKPGNPWFLWTPAEDIVVPYGALKTGAPEITDIPWLAHRIVRRLEDVKDDIKYKNTDKLGANLRADTRRDREFPADMDEEYIELWEVHDVKRKMIYVVAQDYDKYLVEEEDVLQIEGLPFVRLIFNTHPRYFWGISDIKNLEPHQMFLNDVNTIIKDHTRVSIKKFLGKKGAMKAAEINKLLSERSGAYCEVDGNLEDAIKELKFSIPQELFTVKNEIRKDMRELVGYSRNEAGEFDQSSRRTATEATLVKQGSETRSSERRDVVADVVEKSIRKINQIIFERWDSERVIDILGEDGVKYWVSYTKDDIIGEYDIQINAEEAQVIDTDKITQDAIALLQQFGDDQDFSPEERKNIKRTLAAQFNHLGFDLEKALAPSEGLGRNPEQPIPMREWAQGMEKGKGKNALQIAKAGGSQP